MFEAAVPPKVGVIDTPVVVPVEVGASVNDKLASVPVVKLVSESESAEPVVAVDEPVIPLVPEVKLILDAPELLPIAVLPEVEERVVPWLEERVVKEPAAAVV